MDIGDSYRKLQEQNMQKKLKERRMKEMNKRMKEQAKKMNQKAMEKAMRDRSDLMMASPRR
tara:strand:+ start:277 stop:459 length:183 start_codon:yes stop_codon:yes gene_type:complete